MAELKWVGPAGSGAATEITTNSEVTAKRNTALTSAQVDTQIANSLSGYALKTYVDSQDSGKALKTYVDSQDSGKILRSLIGQPNGPIPLSGGRIASSYVAGTYPAQYRSVRSYYSPSSYVTSDQTNLTSRDQVKICSDITIPDQGYPYFVLAMGYWEGQANNNSTNTRPEVRVRATNNGSTNTVGWGMGSINVTEPHGITITPFSTGVPLTGSTTVSTYAGRNTGSGAASIFYSGSYTPPKLALIIIAA